MMFNEKLLELRKEKGLSQEELGEKLGVTRQTVSKWELGSTSPKLDDLVKISNFFEISVDELIGNEKKIKNDENDNLNVNSKNNLNPKKKILLLVLLIIISIYFIYCIYKFIVLGKIQKEYSYIMSKPEDNYGLEYINTTKDIKDWRLFLYNSYNVKILDSLKNTFVDAKFEYDYDSMEYKSSTYDKYDMENKTHTINIYDGFNAEIYENCYHMGDMEYDITCNIANIENFNFIQKLKLSFNPMYSVDNNKDACAIIKGFSNSKNLYIVTIDKNNRRINYFRRIINKDNKADFETTIYNLYSKEFYNDFISKHECETYTLVEE